MPERQNIFGVIILAAGASRRMGRPKLLLPWGETTVVGHLLQQWNRLGAAQIAIVLADGAIPLKVELDRLKFPAADRIINPAPDQGMFSSIQCAARWNGWNPELTHYLITLGDQPHLRDATLQTLLEFSGRHSDKICQPIRGERRKHPVVLPKPFFEKLKETSVTDLKIFLSAQAPHLTGFDSDDVSLDFDIDTPEDYERVKRLFVAGS